MYHSLNVQEMKDKRYWKMAYFSSIKIYYQNYNAYYSTQISWKKTTTNINIKNSTRFRVSRSKNVLKISSWKFLQSLFASVLEIFYEHSFILMEFHDDRDFCLFLCKWVSSA